EWIRLMKASMRTVCCQFNTNRMVEEYAETMYLPAASQHVLLAQNGYAAARELAAWKARIQERWHEVRVLGVEADTSRELEIGADLEVRVTVHLGPISPGEVVVELLCGPLDIGGEILAGDAIPLTYRSAQGPVSVFSGSIPCHEAGRHGFTVRV